MRRKINPALLSVIAVLAAGLIAVPAQAQDGQPHIIVDFSAGTLGIGPEVSYRPVRAFDVRASAAFLGFRHSVNSGGVDYAGSLRLQSYGAALDFYPFKGNFRISGGIRVNHNRVGLIATPTAPVTIGNSTYTPAQIGTLSGTVKGSDLAPIATIGWAGGLTRGVKLGFDVGALFEGSPKAQDLVASNALVSPADISAEQAKINAKLHKFTAYPVLQLSLGYAF
jgi:hypothetical protein